MLKIIFLFHIFGWGIVIAYDAYKDYDRKRERSFKLKLIQERIAQKETLEKEQTARMSVEEVIEKDE